MTMLSYRVHFHFELRLSEGQKAANIYNSRLQLALLITIIYHVIMHVLYIAALGCER